jgi:hypothetical protein
VPFADISKEVGSLDQRKVVASVMGDTSPLLDDPKRQHLAAAAIVILKLVADLAPSMAAKGVYRYL